MTSEKVSLQALRIINFFIRKSATARPIKSAYQLCAACEGSPEKHRSIYASLVREFLEDGTMYKAPDGTLHMRLSEAKGNIGFGDLKAADVLNLLGDLTGDPAGCSALKRMSNGAEKVKGIVLRRDLDNAARILKK